MMFLSAILLFALTASDAICNLLNGESSCSAKVYQQSWNMVADAAEDGELLQQFVIGLYTRDNSTARRYLANARPKIVLLAEKKNNPLAWYLLSVEKNDMDLLKRAVDGENVQALNAMGTIAMQAAFQKKGLTTNELNRAKSESYGYFRRAAAKGDANGFINLGTCYLRGIGCAVDMELAFRCFESAANAGHPEGMEDMAACYQFGHGVAKNTEASLYWTMKARALRGNKAAEKWLRDRK